MAGAHLTLVAIGNDS